MTKDEQDKVRAFRNAVDRFLTSASNPGRASAVVSDHATGSPYDDLVMAKIEVDFMLSAAPPTRTIDNVLEVQAYANGIVNTTKRGADDSLVHVPVEVELQVGQRMIVERTGADVMKLEVLP